MPRTDSQRRYDAKNLKAFSFMVNRKTEADLLAHLQDMPNRATYIKRLIREDMERQGVFDYQSECHCSETPSRSSA